MARHSPYGAFNFIVNFDGGEAFGGFSDVSGIGTEITVAEYRHGNDKENHVRKVPGVHKVGDITLKRGVINSDSVWDWITRRAQQRRERRRRTCRSPCSTKHATRCRPGCCAT